MEYAPFPITDFAGGITDNFIGRESSRYRTARNFIITVDKKLSLRAGSVVDGANDTQGKISAGVEYLLAPFTTAEKPYKLTTNSSYGKLFYYNGTTHAELLGPSSFHLFSTAHGGAGDHRFSTAYWNFHEYITSASFTEKVCQIYQDDLAALQLRTAGLPKYASTNPTVQEPGSGGAASYLMALVYKYTYIVGDQTFVTRSNPYFFKKTVTNGPPNTITPPAGAKLTNGTADHYDIASSNLVLEYYRSINNGTEYFFVGSIQNSAITGSATVADTLSDSDLVLNAPIYTAGGVLGNDPPPVSRFMHVSEKGTAYYGYCADGSDTVRARIRQSKAGVPDACPASFFSDLDDEVTGISSFRGLPIFFARRYAYRGDGVFDSFGQGGLVPTKISDYAGAVSHTGIVQTYFGVFFPGDTGFYWTNGYEVVRISEELPLSYAAAYPSDSSKLAITGTYDEVNQLIYWTYKETANSDACFVLHLRFGIKPDSVFTTIGGNVATSDPDFTQSPDTLPTTINENFRAKHLLSFNNTLYRADDRGYVMRFSSTSRADPRVVTGTNISAWGSTYIYYNFETAALDFGQELVRKWTPQVLTTLKNVGNVSLQIKQDRDLLGVFKLLKEIKQKSLYSWGDPGVLWGNISMWASDKGMYEEKRMLATPGIRCGYRTLRLTNAYTVMQNSDNLGTVTIDASGKTATLNTAGSVWPLDILDYYISFDGHPGIFLVTSNTTTAITFSDSGNVCPPSAAGYKFLLRGYSKIDNLFIQALNLPVCFLTNSQLGYRPNVEQHNA